MASAVQTKKKRDKKKKKEDGTEEFILHQPIIAPTIVADDLNIHVHKEASTGGGLCAKLVFFALLTLLSTLIGLIITEHRGLTDLDAINTESAFAHIFEGWIDDKTLDSHDHEESFSADNSHENEDEEDSEHSHSSHNEDEDDEEGHNENEVSEEQESQVVTEEENEEEYYAKNQEDDEEDDTEQDTQEEEEDEETELETQEDDLESATQEEEPETQEEEPGTQEEEPETQETVSDTREDHETEEEFTETQEEQEKYELNQSSEPSSIVADKDEDDEQDIEDDIINRLPQQNKLAELKIKNQSKEKKSEKMDDVESEEITKDDDNHGELSGKDLPEEIIKIKEEEEIGNESDKESSNSEKFVPIKDSDSEDEKSWSNQRSGAQNVYEFSNITNDNDWKIREELDRAGENVKNE